jgi:hypothetical protein
MSGLFKIKGLEQRKQRLVLQGDIYRQMIRGDAHNLQLAVAGFQKKLNWIQRSKSMLPIVATVMGFFALRRRRKSVYVSPTRSIISFVGRELLRNVLPIGGSFLAKRFLSRRE